MRLSSVLPSILRNFCLFRRMTFLQAFPVPHFCTAELLFLFWPALSLVWSTTASGTAPLIAIPAAAVDVVVPGCVLQAQGALCTGWFLRGWEWWCWAGCFRGFSAIG